MIGRITAVAMEVASEGRGAVRAGPRWTADCGGWSLGWP